MFMKAFYITSISYLLQGRSKYPRPLRWETLVCSSLCVHGRNEQKTSGMVECMEYRHTENCQVLSANPVDCRTTKNPVGNDEQPDLDLLEDPS